ncbi:MAG: hypothetical protein ACJAVV_000131 [Alphaproteobacteria bacterium]|jgi:hypothetical protein
MKKSLICLALAAAVATAGVNAQEQAGGATAYRSADGEFKAPVVAAGYVAAALTVSLISNSNGSAPERVIIDSPPPPPPPLTCSGEDALVDGVCINNTVTTTVTGTGTGTNTGTVTITVPVSSTYAPTN